MRSSLIVHALAMTLATATAFAQEPPPAGKPKKPRHQDLIEMGNSLLDDSDVEADAPKKKTDAAPGKKAEKPGPKTAAPAKGSESPAQKQPSGGAPGEAPAAQPRPTQPSGTAPAPAATPTPAPAPAGAKTGQTPPPPAAPMLPPAANPNANPSPSANPNPNPNPSANPNPNANPSPNPNADASPPPAPLANNPLPVDGGAPPDATPPLAALAPAPDLLMPAAPAPAVVEPGPQDAPIIPGVMTPEQRVRSGRNYPMKGAAQSPLAKVLPPRLVPAAATVVILGVMAIWPFLLKTLTGLLKKVIGSRLKGRAKKGKKIEKEIVELEVFGIRVRPAELAALLVAAVTYGLAVCYTLKGWKMDSRFVLREESLVIGIYYSRSIIRFLYERLFGLATRFRFWPGGGLLCLTSAYLGNTLGTVGYELEAAKTEEETNRVIKMKAWLVVLALAMAIGFFTANLLHPDKVLQSGRVMTSGMALGDVMPFAPMPGLKIFRWKRPVWTVLFVLVVPTFFAINFFL